MNEGDDQGFDGATLPRGIQVRLRRRDPAPSRRAASVKVRTRVDHPVVFARIIRPVRKIIASGSPLSGGFQAG